MKTKSQLFSIRSETRTWMSSNIGPTLLYLLPHNWRPARCFSLCFTRNILVQNHESYGVGHHLSVALTGRVVSSSEACVHRSALFFVVNYVSNTPVQYIRFYKRPRHFVSIDFVLQCLHTCSCCPTSATRVARQRLSSRAVSRSVCQLIFDNNRAAVQRTRTRSMSTHQLTIVSWV